MERLYKEEDLQLLFDGAKAINKHLGEQPVREVCERVKKDLDAPWSITCYFYFINNLRQT